MKRLLFLILLCSPLLFTSCEDQYYVTEEYYGPTVNSYYIEVLPSHWKSVEDAGGEKYILEAAYNVNYITQDVIDNGAVIAYFIDPDGFGDFQMPYVFSRIVSGVKSMDVIRYELRRGQISFIIDNLDFIAVPYDVPVEFKIVVVR